MPLELWAICESQSSAPRPRIRSPGRQAVEVLRTAETGADQAPLGIPSGVPG